jgi:hypothetical protein
MLMNRHFFIIEGAGKEGSFRLHELIRDEGSEMPYGSGDRQAEC